MKFLSLIFLLGTLSQLAMQPLAAQDLDTPSGKTQLDIRPAEVIIWEGVEARARQDGTILVGLRLTTKQGFSIYRKRLKVEGPAGTIASITQEPLPREQEDPMGEGRVEVFDGGDFQVELKGDAPPRESQVKIKVTSLGCTQKICLFPYTQELTLPVFLESDPAASPAPGKESPTASIDSTQSQAKPKLSLEETYAERLKSGALPFWLVLIVCFVGGIATNLTPCVFPMIPITLRLLAQQGQRPVTATSFYAAGIIVTYTALGVIASLSGGFFGSLLSHPSVNIAFACLFGLLGFTMLGFGNFSKLQNIGAQFGSGKASVLNAFGMGAGAGLVAAPCTGPIMGALLAYAAAQKSSGQALSLFFVYSLGFALPYLLLGFVANKVAVFKLSPKVQLAVKILFAAGMFGLSAYYLKNPAREVLSLAQGSWWWLGLVLVGLGITLSAIVLSSSHMMLMKSTQLLPSLVLGLGLFAGSQWIAGGDIRAQLHWLHSEEEAFAMAAQTNKPILVDGWAEWCPACKQLDQTTFLDPLVIEELEANWVILKLDLTELTDANDALAEKYGMQGLPTLAMLPSDASLEKKASITGYVKADRLLAELQAFRGK